MMTCVVLVLLSLGTFLPPDVSGACSVTTLRFDWNNKGIGWSVTNPDKTQVQAEGILDQAQIVINVITDEITTFTFDIARQIDVLYVEAKLTHSVKISGIDQNDVEVYTNTKPMADPNVNEGFTFDDFPTDLIKKIEVEPVLMQVSSEARFKNLYMDICSTVPCSDTTQIDWFDRRNGIDVSNPDKTTEAAEAILFGTTASLPSVITDETTTIAFDSARHVKNLYVESKFNGGVEATVSSQSETKYLANSNVNTAVEFNLLAAGPISSVGVTPVDFPSEGRLKNLKMDVCIDTCSVITASDVTISPGRYANILTSGQETWITKQKIALFEFNPPVNVKSIKLFARRFNTDLQIVGKTSNNKEVFSYLIQTTASFPANPFDTDSIFPATDPLQLSVSTIEMIAAGAKRGKVKDIEITVCPFSQ